MTVLKWVPESGSASPPVAGLDGLAEPGGPGVAGPGGGDGRRGADLIESLLAGLEDLPAEPTAAARVLWIADDPRSSARDLASAVSVDPALTARTMRMANSAYYGLSGKVSSATFAVTVLGFSTVRSLALATAVGVVGEEVELPPGFWDHAAASACGASLMAPRVDVNRHDAFSLGLLHDLGDALLLRAAPEAWASIRDEVGDPHGPEQVRAELAAFGLDHAEAAARVLGAWRFPPVFVEAIEHHHRPTDRTASSLRRALVAGNALATVAGARDRVEEQRAVTAGMADLALAGVDKVSASALAAQVRKEAAELTLTLSML